jgi:iron(III) transport system substrate-binding protein
MTQRRRWTILGALAGLAVLVSLLGGYPAAGQGGSVQEKLDRLSRLTGAERQRYLEEEAFKEGKVVMYSSDHPELVRAWNAEFKKKYPQIDSQFIRMNTRDALQRAVNESRAGRPVTDLLHPPAWFAPAVVGFNTNLIQRAEVPTRIEDLADPKFKGKLGRVSAGGRWVAGILKAKGEAAGMDIVRRLAQQEPRIYESSNAVGNALASGQIAIAFDLHVTVAGPLKTQGAPVDYVIAEPLLILPVYQIVMKDAPHPFAAALAYDWMLSKQGQALYKPLDQIGPRKDTEYPFADVMRGAKTVVSLSVGLLAEPARYNKIFEDLYIRK